MNWLCLFLCVCLILQSLHLGMRLNRVEKSFRNWSHEIVDECNSQLNQRIAAYRSHVNEWLRSEFDVILEKKSIDEYIDSVKINLNKDE